MAFPPAAPGPVIDHAPEWDDPWGNPNYYAGITIRRIFAYCLDLVVVMLLLGIGWIAAILVGGLTLGLLWPVMMLGLALLPVAYHSLTIGGERAATFGMRAAGIRVMASGPAGLANGGRPTLLQAAIQTVCFYGTVMVTGSLILVVALFNPRRRTLHDMLSGVVVVNDPAGWKS